MANLRIKQFPEFNFSPLKIFAVKKLNTLSLMENIFPKQAYNGKFILKTHFNGNYFPKMSLLWKIFAFLHS
jgi:hypothetical protein